MVASLRIASLFALIATAALSACHEKKEPSSLVADFPVPGTYALAGDTLTVWKRTQQPSGAWQFHAYSITPGGTVEALEELERVDAPAVSEEALDFSERRKGFTLPQSEFETIRSKAALLRPASLGPKDPVGGYGGEAYARGCAPDKTQPRIAGINFLNNANWGAFILQPGCSSASGRAAEAVMTDIFTRLERAAGEVKQAQR